MIKKLLSLFLILALCLTPAAAAEEEETLSQSGRVIAEALSYMGYTEGARESTIFGQRYGYPNGYWCDMFVSWCAEEAGVPAEIFPVHVTCSVHCRLFKEMGCFQSSSAYEGNYIPRQGDLVFFCYTGSKAIHHIGLVLYVEDGKLFTVEGNTVTNRLDHPAAEVSALRKGALDPPDYVTVNIYELNDPRLYGYAVPPYESREPLELEGYADLAQYAGLQDQLADLAAAGIMRGTSSHTFSPRGGMPRGEFAQSVLALCRLTGWDADTVPFADVPEDSPYYEAAMAARSAGLIQGDENNCFYPGIYITGADAQSILSKALAIMGREDRTFTFRTGDLAYLLEPYSARIDLAQALYDIWAESLVTEPYTGVVALDGEVLDWTARSLDEACWLPLPRLLERFEELTVSGGSGNIRADGTAPDGYEDTGLAAPPKAPNENGGQSTRATVSLTLDGREIAVDAFLHDGIFYIPLESAAELLSAELQAELPETTAG